jgi:hypothetical protein
MFKATTHPKQPTTLEMSCFVISHFLSNDVIGFSHHLLLVYDCCSGFELIPKACVAFDHFQ